MNMQSIRRSAFAVLLTAPVWVLAQTPPASKAAKPTSAATPISAAKPASSVPRDLRLGKIQDVFTQEQLQAFMSPATQVAVQPIQASQVSQSEPLSDVVVRSAAGNKPRGPIEAKPCGLASVVWFIEHPAEGWRIFAPIETGSELEVCLTPPVTKVVSPYPPL